LAAIYGCPGEIKNNFMGKYISNYVLAFIDVLGQQTALKKVKHYLLTKRKI